MKHNSIFLCLLLLTRVSWAESIVFPPDAGVVDVTQAPYSAKGDGVTDDTAAIQRAFNDYAGRGIIYLPNGTYRVSDTLAWAGRCTRTILQRQSEGGTIIRLADRAPGFGDPTKAKPVVYTGTFPPQRFRNAIRNLTIDTGKANAGAIGCRFNASNQGNMMHVTIRSGDGRGPIGLDMGYTSDVGPLFIKNLRVFGFDVGIYTAYGVAGQAMEHILVANQDICGWVNDGQAVSVHGFISSNSVPALWNKDLGGHIVLLDAQLSGAGAAAIINDASLYARNIQAAGYAQAIGGLRSAKGTNIDEFVSHPVESLFPSPTRALRLPVEETPEVPWDDPKEWVSVRRFEPKVVTVTKEKKGKPVTEKLTDWTEAIQQAIDSGATTVYFPRGGDYEVLGTVHIRGKVRRLMGMEGALGRQGHGIFQLDDGEAPLVLLERFDWIYSPITVRTTSKRTLVVSAVAGGKFEIGTGGKAFFEDVVNLIRLGKDAQVWIRQFNVSGSRDTGGKVAGGSFGITPG